MTSVRWKFIAVMGLTILVMAFVSTALPTLTVSRLSEEIGERVVEEKVEAVNNALDREVEGVDKICRDWAYWDDTYEFVLNKNRDYVESNLVNETFIDVEVNYIIFVDAHKNVVWAGAYDYKNETPMEIPEKLYKFVKSVNGEVKGVADFGSPTFIAVRKILPSNESGEARGLVIFARKVYDEDVSALTGFPVHIVAPRTTALSSGNVTVFVPVKDVRGATIANAVFSVYPFWLEISSNSIRSVLVSVVITALALSIAVITMLDRELRRILSVGEFLKEVEDFRGRISVTGNDEISELAKNVNALLERIERSTKGVRSLNEALSFTNKILRHDVKNKLAAISLFAELGSESGEKEYYGRIRRICDEIMRTLNRLRDVEDKEGVRSVKLSEVVKEVMAGYDVEWNWRGDEEIAVLADNGLYAVIDNLVHNAITHGKTERVDFEAIEKGEVVELRVKDYGAGIPEEVRERVFEEGFSTSGSTGLGLFIAKKLVEGYGGKLTCENHPDGAVFIVELPKGH